MTKAFIADVLQDSLDCTGIAANQVPADSIGAIVKDMKKQGGFTLPSFGTFTVCKTKARKALNPRTGEAVKVKADKTARREGSSRRGRGAFSEANKRALLSDSRVFTEWCPAAASSAKM